MNSFVNIVGKECKNANSLRNHERMCKQNPERQVSPFVKLNAERGAWNKGLTAETDERVKKYGKTFSERYKGTDEGKRIMSHPHTEEYKQKMREIAIRRHLGGWHTSKTIKYDDKTLDSTYELEVAKSLDENSIEWTRPNYLIWQDDAGRKHRYYPDFYLPKYNVYLDPKNDFLINRATKRFGITDAEKINKVSEQNNVKIVILDKNNLNWQNIKNLL